jgi:uncharacterized protein (TIGR03067 family)
MVKVPIDFPNLGEVETADADALLAVRAARRAVAANPRDANAYLALGQAYYLLWRSQEGGWTFQSDPTPLSFRGLDLAFRQTLRLVQTVTALHHALTLNPSLEQAHNILFQVYVQMHYFDAAAHHLGERVKILRDIKFRRRSGEKPEAFEKRQSDFKKGVKDLQKRLKGLEQEVDRRSKDYRRNAINQPLQRKFTLSLLEPYKGQKPDPLGRGLANTGLDLLLKAKGSEKDPMLAIWQIRLLMTLGRLQEAREDLPALEDALARIRKQKKKNPKLGAMEGPLDFSIAWYKVLLAAAAGHYTEADELLDALVKKTHANPRFLRYTAGYLLQGATFSDLLRRQMLVRQGVMPLLEGQMMESMRRLAGPLRSEADFHLLRGLLALEHGETTRAYGELAKTLRLTQHLTINPQPRTVRDKPTDYNDARIAQRYVILLAREKLQGTWKLRSATVDGSNVPTRQTDGRWSRLVIRRNRYRTPKTAGTIVISPLIRPQALYLRVEDGPGKKTIRYCSYELDGDRLKVAFYSRRVETPVQAARGVAALVAAVRLNPALAAATVAGSFLPHRPKSFKASRHADLVVLVYQRVKE